MSDESGERDDKGERQASEPRAGPQQGAKSGASRDLAEGLELVLRAARKAVRQVESGRLEELGRRALGSLENLDKRKVGELGRKAAKNLDPRRIEEIAEDAGRELLNVVERVADRVEEIMSGSKRDSGAPPARAESSKPEREVPEPPPGAAEMPPRKIRVDDK
jgi:hypothetical protein